MNALTPQTTPTNDEVIRVLENSLYPGAKAESIALVLSYCRVNGLDPMLKPVHIVPTNVKVGRDKWEWRDVLMPGIADYRIKAARSGEYGGKSEPEFGPEKEYTLGGVKCRAPEWCRVTVSRIVQGQARTFAAVERWLENYATAGKDTEAPNRMWLKRSYGQLAKCAEAQALRMAFPEFSGGQPTAEEMEGKADFSGPTIEHEPSFASQREQINAEAPMSSPEPAKPKRMTIRVWLDAFEAECRNVTNEEQANALLDRPDVVEVASKLPEAAMARYDSVKAEMLSKIYTTPPDDYGEQGDELPLTDGEKQAADLAIARAGA